MDSTAMRVSMHQATRLCTTDKHQAGLFQTEPFWLETSSKEPWWGLFPVLQCPATCDMSTELSLCPCTERAGAVCQGWQRHGTDPWHGHKSWASDGTRG